LAANEPLQLQQKNKNAVGVGVGDVKGERITTMAALQGKEASNVMYL